MDRRGGPRTSKEKRKQASIEAASRAADPTIQPPAGGPELGRAFFESETELVAGSSQPVLMRYVAGSRGIRKGGSVRVELPGRLAWTRPQLRGFESAGYVEVLSDNTDAVLQLSVESVTPGRQDRAAAFKVDPRVRVVRATLVDGALRKGESILFCFGPPRFGFCPGYTASIIATGPRGCVEQFVVTVATTPRARLRSLAKQPQLRLVGDAVSRVFVKVPSSLPLGAKARGAAVPVDAYANPSHRCTGTLTVGRGALAAAQRLRIERPFAVRKAFSVQAARAGIHRIELQADVEAARADNTLVLIRPKGTRAYGRAVCEVNADPAAHRLFWGDLHVHTGLSNDCKIRERLELSPRQIAEYARDVAGMDFVGFADHHQPVDAEKPVLAYLRMDEWAVQCEAARRLSRSGAFVVFPGIEYRGPERRGDTNLTFKDSDAPYPLYARESLQKIYRFCREQGADVLSTVHFHPNNGHRPAGARNARSSFEIWKNSVDHRHERLMEIYSGWGRYEHYGCYPWATAAGLLPDTSGLVRPQILHGARFGIYGSGDDHKGHAGLQGITGVWASKLTRDALFEALHARRTYAASHAKMLLRFKLGAHWMGEEVPASEVSGGPRVFSVTVAGTEDLRRVELLCNEQVIATVDPKGWKLETQLEDRRSLGRLWRNSDYDGSRFIAYRLRAVQMDWQYAWSSPIWIVPGD